MAKTAKPNSAIFTRVPNQTQDGFAQFWKLQVIYWCGVSVLSFFSVSPWFDQFGLNHLLHMAFQGLLGGLLAYPLHIVFSIVWNSSLRLRILISMLSVALVAAIWNVFRMATFILATGQEDVWRSFGDWYFGGIYVFLCWTALYHGIRYYQLLQTETVMKLEAEAVVSKEKFKRLYAESETREAQLKMLRYQLNPHFLFNTLNAINSLVGTGEPEKAQSMIVKLSQFLRYSLDNNPEMKISLDREVTALNQYLEIEKTRFGDRLNISISLEEEVRQALLPSLLLQPLLENSMKHAIAKSVDGGSIELTARREDQKVVIEIGDSGPGVSLSGDRVSSQQGRGIGLRNTIDRLKAFYGARFSFDLDSTDQGGLKVVIKIPYET
jgi:sensor histidine kinase YesM